MSRIWSGWAVTLTVPAGPQYHPLLATLNPGKLLEPAEVPVICGRWSECGKDVCADSDCLVPSDTIWGQGGLLIPDLSPQPSGLAGKERPRPAW